jgi:hypothetical protein
MLPAMGVRAEPLVDLALTAFYLCYNQPFECLMLWVNGWYYLHGILTRDLKF